jgi:hypothetical protein
VQFPYFYRMFERRPSGYQVHLHAWLGRELGEIAPSEGAPYGKAFAELCECSTEGAAYADATITLDALAK